jgi:RNA recognition motif-containing protein
MTALIVLALGLGVAKPALAAKKLFVGNLPYATTAADVEDLVSRYGAVMSISVVGMDVDGAMSAEATVAFERPRDAVAAADALHGMEVGGQPITANVKRVLVVGSKVKEVTSCWPPPSSAARRTAAPPSVHTISRSEGPHFLRPPARTAG